MSNEPPIYYYPKATEVQDIRVWASDNYLRVLLSALLPDKKKRDALMIYEKSPELKYKYHNREFWCRGYYVDTAGKPAKKIEEYIKHQLDEDKAGEQMTMPNFLKSLFAGGK